MPVYATKLAAGLIRNKLEEHKLLRSTKLKEVKQGQAIKLGKFKVEVSGRLCGKESPSVTQSTRSSSKSA